MTLMKTPYDDYDFVVNEIHAMYGAKVIKKESSPLHQVLGWLLFWTWRFSFSPFKFERTYMTRYTTVIGATIATPDKQIDTAVIMHEAQHIEDLTLLMRIAYLLPNALAPLAVLAVWYSNWWLLCVLLVVCPSPGRAWAELRGYTVSLAMHYRRSGGAVSDSYLNYLVGHFTGPTYLWMWPFRSWVRNYFKGRIEDFQAISMHRDPSRSLPLWAYKAVSRPSPDLEYSPGT